jgi:hypothetical protein
MVRTARLVTAVATACLAPPAWAQPPERPAVREKAPWGALTDSVAAGEIVLRDVCLTGIAHGGQDQFASARNKANCRLIASVKAALWVSRA